jgi:ubiquinone/menaquinone biosynthesis C-methylase UbiE
MEPKLHRRVQRYGWDLAVADYDRHWVPVLRTCSERVLALCEPRPGERVIDLATGTGVAAFLAAERVGDAGRVTATDLSERMVDAVRAEAARRGAANIEAERVDAEELAYAGGSFDVATCVLGLMYPADPQRAIEQMYRVLAPGGRAGVCVWGRRDRCGWREIFPIVDAIVQSDVCPMFFSLGGPQALDYAFERAGFVERREERLAQTLHWPDARTACAAMFGGGPVALAYSKMTPEVRGRVERAFIDSIAPYRNADGSYDVEGEFVFMLGTKA